ncbi:hypothetical protein K2173_010126 [Erythroxylum novogranatense]|uniref:Uncharacterized protein n=1 Tax=Erythroxylum novogranatense TaxID=1862640 RepID=A0AAV8TSY6_9ROSI|nr:hypothetical protein K2173_010126 [Erythroxylum novogranatense]
MHHTTFEQHPVNGVPVVANNEYPVHLQHGQEVPWSSGLCDCFSDMPSCCLTAWCPCITFCRIADIVDKGKTTSLMSGGVFAILACATGCSGLYSWISRSKMRKEYMLEETPCNDFCVHCCCEPCALCQEYRELQNRGFDMSIGWQANLEKQNQGVAMTAPPTQAFDGVMRK